MINLLVDESFAFDYLSIFMVKATKNGTEHNHANVIKCFNHLSDQVGNDLMDDILASPEFARLMECNEKVFDLVQRARDGEQSPTLAKAVDDGNMERFRAKVALQNKFFKNNVTEVKS